MKLRKRGDPAASHLLNVRLPLSSMSRLCLSYIEGQHGPPSRRSCRSPYHYGFALDGQRVTYSTDGPVSYER